MDFSKLTVFERQHYDEVIKKCEEYKDENDENFCINFFKQMWDNLDYKTETRPVIIFSTPSFTGTDAFRLRLPLYSLFKKYANKFYIILTDNMNLNMIKFSDIIIQHRAGDLHVYMNDVINMWPRGFNKPIICHEVDDNEHNLPNSHPLKEAWIKHGKDKMSIKQLTHADFVTTTGMTLRRTFGNLNKSNKVFIIPNAFQWKNKQWIILTDEEKENCKPELAKGKTTVGWAGLTSHFPDLMKMLELLRSVQLKIENKDSIHFILSGMPITDIMHQKLPDGRIVDVPTPENMTYKNRLMRGFEKFPGYLPVLGEESCTFQDVKGLFNYGEFYDQYDINLAYLAENSPFNKSKSPIKVIEGFRKGAISVWTNFGGYEEFYNNLPTELKKIAFDHMASDSDVRFVENIVYWINNPNERKKWAKIFQDYVTETFDIEKINEKRYEIYTKMLNL